MAAMPYVVTQASNVGRALPAIQDSLPRLKHRRDACTTNFLLLNFFAFSLGALILLAALLGLFAAEFPDDAAGAEFAVNTGVCAGPAHVQAFLAVAELHLLADHAGVPVRVKTAFVHAIIISKHGVSPKATGSAAPFQMDAWLI
jgi:hypothetical protein